MAKQKRRMGRPKGSKNKNKSILGLIDGGIDNPTPTEGRGRKRGRPPGGKRRGRPARTNTTGKVQVRRGRRKSNPSLLTPDNIRGIHFIGKTLIVDTNEMQINEVIFLGEGKQPKVR